MRHSRSVGRGRWAVAAVPVKRLGLVLGLLMIVVAATALTFPGIIRWIVITRVQALTNRHVSLDAASLSIRDGRLTIRGLRLTDRDGQTPFAAVDELDVSLNRRALFHGHLWIRELAIRNSTVRVVRLSSNEFNLSDLVRRSGTTGTTGPTLDVTVDRFTVAGGTVTLEDQALPGRRTWTSEHIAIDARNVSTLHTNGTAIASSVTDGALVSVTVKRLRLYPIDLAATVTVEGADLALARLYMPAEAPVVLDRGRASASVDVALHARDGLRVDATARFDDVALTRPGERQPVALAPATTVRLGGVSLQDSGMRLGQVELAGSITLFDPRVTPVARFELPGMRMSVANLTWPVSEPARIDLRTGVPGRGQLAVVGTLQPAPVATDLRVHLTKMDLTPWARYLPPSVRISGIAEADLRVNEPIRAGVPARIRGSIAVKSLGAADARETLMGVQRIEATGLEVHWPTRIIIKRLLVTRPSAIVKRDRAGRFPLQALLTGPTLSASAVPVVAVGAEPVQPDNRGLTDRATPSARALPPITVEIGETVIQDGAVAWRDEAVTPPTQLDVAQINATVKGVGWPLRGPLGAQVVLEPPRGGELRVVGQVGVGSPPTADLRVTLKGGELAPYQVYLPTPARISGRAEFDVAVTFPGAAEGSTSVRGQAVLSRLDIRDRERTVMRVERVSATGLDVEWPQRVSISDLALLRPWMLLERDERGALPLRAMLPAQMGAPPTGTLSTNGRPKDTPLAVAVRRITLADGGARLVDRSIAPSFALDLDRLTLKLDGFSTAPAQPAHIELTGRVASDAAVALQGTVGPFGGPLRLDVNGELREFAIPRTNPYLLRQVAWKAREGRLMATIGARIRGDTLDARSDIRLRQLEVERAGPNDQAQAHIGLPLGLIVSLMKSARGEITVSFPVSGRLSDPRFDFSEAIWRSARTVAVNAIAAPVSWIGRLHYTADSRIERIQIDPIQFRPGTATLTLEGEAQTMRLAGFLQQLPEVRIALTPLVTSGDLARQSRRALEGTIGRAAREAKITSEEAAARLFAQRFPNRQLPETSEAVLGALVESEPSPTGDVAGLAAKRMDAVRSKFKQANVDTARLVENKVPERREAVEGGVQVDLVEPDRARPPDFFDRLRRLGAGITGRPSP